MTHIKDTLHRQDEQYTAYENNSLRFEKLMQRIEQIEEPQVKTHGNSITTSVAQWLERTKIWLFEGASPQLRYATLAMAALLVGQTAYLILGTNEITYLAASGDPPTKLTLPITSTYFVIFSSSAEIGAISDLLKATNGHFINGPQSGATAYRLGFANKPSAEVLAQYENSELVEFIGESE